MFFVIVDMGPDASADRMAWVLEACNSAVRNGRCVGEPPADDESPQAVAIVRVRDVRGRLVRIEVGRRREQRALWSVRELEFSRRDPEDERWRSVGLALATLVGEIEEAVLEAPDEQAPSAAPEAPPPTEEAASPPAPSTASADAPDADAPDEEVSDDDVGVVSTELDAEPELPREPFSRPRGFVGVGALAGQGSTATPVRWGGGARGVWLFDSGLLLSLAGDYSTLDVEPGLELDWLRLTSGVGYRHFITDAWSFGLTLRAGVRGLGVAARRGTLAHDSRAWSFLMSGSADGWWQLTQLGGVWLELDLATIGRATRLFARQDLESEVPFGDAAALLGVWLSL